MIVALAGLPGTGKSTLAQALAAHFGGAVVSKDSLRAAAFPPPWTLYTTEQDDFVMGLMLQCAAFLVEHSCPAVFLDGRTLSRAYQREGIIQASARWNRQFRLVECVCPDRVAIARIESGGDAHPAANRNAELYWKVKARFEPILQPKVVANTNQPLSITLAQTIAALTSGPVAE
jgi:predicted kinase